MVLKRFFVNGEILVLFLTTVLVVALIVGAIKSREGREPSFNSRLVVPGSSIDIGYGMNIITIDGHEYIFMTGKGQSGICHKADCSFCTKKEEK